LVTVEAWITKECQKCEGENEKGLASGARGWGLQGEGGACGMGGWWDAAGGGGAAVGEGVGAGRGVRRRCGVRG